MEMIQIALHRLFSECVDLLFGAPSLAHCCFYPRQKANAPVHCKGDLDLDLRIEGLVRSH